LEEENRRLKKIVADQALDISALKEALHRKCNARSEAIGGVLLARADEIERTPRLWIDRTGWVDAPLISGEPIGTVRCGNGYANWPSNAVGLAIDACTSCCAAKVRR
jgi:hypothetical protein